MSHLFRLYDFLRRHRILHDILLNHTLIVSCVILHPWPHVPKGKKGGGKLMQASKCAAVDSGRSDVVVTPW